MMALHGLLAQESATTSYVLTRLQSMTEWWHWLVLLLVCGGILAVVIAIYLRDSLELRAGISWTLMCMRVAALLGVLFFFFNLERRSEEQLPKSSRVLMLVDTSQSMGIKDSQPETGNPRARIDDIVQELEQGNLLETLRQKHEVVVYRFDQSPKPTEVATFARIRTEEEQEEFSAEMRLQQALISARTTSWFAGAFLVVGVLCLVVFAIGARGRSADKTSWALLLAVISLITTLVVFAVACLRHPDVGPLVVLGLKAPEVEVQEKAAPTKEVMLEPGSIAWKSDLQPRGVETRLGEALTFVIEKERGGPVAGVIVVSDGRSNAGVDYTQAIVAARDARIPVFSIGLGSDRQPSNIRLVDLDAPQRVYPGDKFTLTGYVQAFGVDTTSLKVELHSRPAPPDGVAEDTPFEFESDSRVDLGSDGEVVMIKFESRSAEEGRRDYQVKLIVPTTQEQNQDDDQRVARVEVVDRRSKVLLMAGGPSREFRFLRDLLYRDEEVTSSVLLQTAAPGASQEADEMLFEFPKTSAELFEYDCIVAFDPDWLELDDSQIGWLEEWVADKAGGLIVVAGPVHTPQWANRRQRSTRISKLRSLYPVVLYRPTSATLSMGRFGSTEAWPLSFTRDGTEAEFLWLEDDAVGNEQGWASFSGVYGYYAVQEPKPGALVFARFSDPSTQLDNKLPIYMASHFYGAGRVFFQASGEMWRIREVDDTYFETYYTKLIRWVSQGRLLRDSNQGVLLVDKERCLLGDQIGVRAILMNEQHEPLTQDDVSAVLFQPDGQEVALTLRRLKDAARPGMYAGQFMALAEGDYRIELQTETADSAVLTREVRARVPQLEVEQPERNDALLKDLTDRTGGAYYIGVAAAMNRDGTGRVPLANLVESRDQIVYLPGTPDRDFEEQLMAWLMGLICGVLCLEWLVRRLSKLA